MAPDPYETLGIRPSASDADVRTAYRRLVQKYHPDHNNGSHESERRFEEVQDAYAKIRELRAVPADRSAAGTTSGSGTPPPRARAQTGASRGQASSPPPTFDPNIEARAAALERELKEAHLARERAREAAREAARQAAQQSARRAAADAEGEGSAADSGRRPGRPSDEELGYIKTNDSFTKILSDAREELSDRFSEAHGHPVVQRVSDLIDELDALASKLTGDRPSRDRR